MARAYLVSLPCVASVSDDGTVTLSVDPLELGNAIREEAPDSPDMDDTWRVYEDAVTADAAVRAGRVTIERMGR